jgi:hypothetical protein
MDQHPAPLSLKAFREPAQRWHRAYWSPLAPTATTSRAPMRWRSSTTWPRS